MPSAALTGELVGRTERSLDSTLGADYGSLDLRPDPDAQVEINTLADVDAADVTAFRVTPTGALCGLSSHAAVLRARRHARRHRGNGLG